MNPHSLNLRNTYEFAAIVEESVKYVETFSEIDWRSPDVLGCLVKFNKISLLHYYIYQMISVDRRILYRDWTDDYDGTPEQYSEIEEMFNDFNISYLSFEKFIDLHSLDPDEDAIFYPWFLYHEQKFMSLWKQLTNEVFHILFANRTFLLSFNEALSDYLASGMVSIPTSSMHRGHLKRQRYFPVWLKKAVFHRDQGRCVFCQTDLTRLINTVVPKHYDHIVPLNRWGTNDPSNIQLLCADCNLSKSGKKGQTSTLYQPWW